MMNNILIIVILIGLIDITISLNKNIIKKGLSIGTSILLSSIYEFIDDYCDGIDNIKGLTTEYINKKYLKIVN